MNSMTPNTPETNSGNLKGIVGKVFQATGMFRAYERISRKAKVACEIKKGEYFLILDVNQKKGVATIMKMNGGAKGFLSFQFLQNCFNLLNLNDE